MALSLKFRLRMEGVPSSKTPQRFPIPNLRPAEAFVNYAGLTRPHTKAISHPFMPDPAAPPDVRRRRLLFRATHRGTHETDLLVGGYVAARLPLMDEAELTALEALVELPDVDLADWLTGRRPIPQGEASALLHRIRDAGLQRAADRLK